MQSTWRMAVVLEMKERALDGLEALGYEIKGLSEAKCPVDTGTLRGSSKLIRRSNKIEVGYGGAASDYALVQHENLSYHHTVGQAKYLESAFDELKGQIHSRIKAAMSSNAIARQAAIVDSSVGGSFEATEWGVGGMI